MTFAIYAVVSTKVFNTFLCDTYGDDPIYYLVADQRIDCESDKHKVFKWYAMFIVLVYPVGIPLLYFTLLTRHKATLQAKDRDEQKQKNGDIRKLAFLWDEYEPQYWWFEIYVCWQRMSLSGILVFIKPGSVIQVLVGLLFALGNIHMYVGKRAKLNERVVRTKTRSERRKRGAKRRVPFYASLLRSSYALRGSLSDEYYC